jgi:hypothetical protein
MDGQSVMNSESWFMSDDRPTRKELAPPSCHARNHAISGGYQGVLLLPLPLPLLLLLHGIPVCRAGE